MMPLGSFPYIGHLIIPGRVSIHTQLFTDTFSGLLNGVVSDTCEIPDGGSEINILIKFGRTIEKLTGQRTFFVYVGHEIRGSTSNKLKLTPRISGDEEMNNMITKSAFLGRVEFMTATSLGDLSNSRADGDTFTQDLCKSFVKRNKKTAWTRSMPYRAYASSESLEPLADRASPKQPILIFHIVIQSQS
jgi:hypothetical protein